MKRYIVLALLTFAATGCATIGANQQQGFESEQVSLKTVQVERGRPLPLLDGVGWVLGAPNKLALWDRRADNHAVSEQTEVALVSYLEENNLQSVMVRVNQYDPIGEWMRLIDNKKVGAGWRYTMGSLNLIKYTLLPGRLVGGDWYNPYTDTVHIYSDIPSIALSEGAYAKDVQKRVYPGAYAFGQELPILGMWHETLANQEVLDYVQLHGTDQEKEEAFRILYPNYAGKWGEHIVSFLPYGNLAGRLAGAAVGHTVNGVRLHSQPEQIATVGSIQSPAPSSQFQQAAIAPKAPQVLQAQNLEE